MKIAKEVLRHVLKRPVVGVNLLARTQEGDVLLIRRGDTGQWALPGGTVEWGETLRATAARELLEEAGVKKVQLGDLLGVYSAPGRDPRFHAVTVVVGAIIAPPESPPSNPVEILEARVFNESEIPRDLSHGNQAMLDNALRGRLTWE